MEYKSTLFLNSEEKEAVFDLWNKEYPENLMFNNTEDLDKYLNGLSDIYHVLVKGKNSKIIGWHLDFIREKECWFAMILESSIHEKGIGTRLLNMAKKRNSSLNGWVIDNRLNLKADGNHYRSPVEFYLKNEFQLLPEIRLELPFISAV